MLWTILLIVWLAGFAPLAFVTVGMAITDRDMFEDGLAWPIIVSIVGSAIWPLLVIFGAIDALGERRQRAKRQPSQMQRAYESTNSRKP